MKDSLKYFLQSWSLGDELPQHLLVVERLYFFLSFLKVNFTFIVFLVDRFFFFFLSALWICHPILSWPVSFLLKNLLLVWCRFSYIWPEKGFLLLFLEFFVFALWNFDYNVPWRKLSELYIFGFLWASCIYMFKSLSRPRNFPAIFVK